MRGFRKSGSSPYASGKMPMAENALCRAACVGIFASKQLCRVEKRGGSVLSPGAVGENGRDGDCILLRCLRNIGDSCRRNAMSSGFEMSVPGTYGKRFAEVGRPPAGAAGASVQGTGEMMFPCAPPEKGCFMPGGARTWARQRRGGRPAGSAA